MISSLPVIGDIIGEIGSTVRKAIPDKDQADRLLSDITGVFTRYQTELLKQKGAIITAEVHSKSWLARNWRPSVMITFTGLIVAHWFGWTAPNLTEGEILSLLDLVKIGIGGYIGGRTLEKIAPGVIDAIKKRKE